MKSRRSETTREAIAAVRPGLRNMAQRIAQGEAVFIKTLMSIAAITHDEAKHVLRVYRKNKILSERGGEIKVKHGGFLEASVIRRAVLERA